MELDEHLNAPFDEEVATAPDGFRCDTDDKAAWALRKLRDARNRLAAIDEQAAEGRLRISQWVEREQAKPLRDVATFEGMLRAYHETELARDPKRKTIRLPDGELQARTGRVAVEVFDEEAFVAWADDGHHEFIRIKVAPDKPALASLIPKQVGDGEVVVVADDGEIVPGVALRQGPRTFTATPYA